MLKLGWELKINNCYWPVDWGFYLFRYQNCAEYTYTCSTCAITRATCICMYVLSYVHANIVHIRAKLSGLSRCFHRGDPILNRKISFSGHTQPTTSTSVIIYTILTTFLLIHTTPSPACDFFILPPRHTSYALYPPTVSSLLSNIRT